MRFLAIALELKDQRSQKLLKHCQMIKKTKPGDLISLDLLYWLLAWWHWLIAWPPFIKSFIIIPPLHYIIVENLLRWKFENVNCVKALFWQKTNRCLLGTIGKLFVATSKIWWMCPVHIRTGERRTFKNTWKYII